ncbi:MAG: glycosyltransferase family 4 protein, partial [Candidatus Limnocylindrales bacterium]
MASSLDVSAATPVPAWFGRLRIGVVYLVLYHLVYVALIAPNFTGFGLVNRLAGDGSFVLATALAIVPAPALPAAARRPSDVGLWILYLAAYVPSIVVPAFVLGTGWALVPLWLTLAVSFGLIICLLELGGRVRIPIPTVSLPIRVYGWGLVVSATVGVVAILLWFGVPTRIPSLDEVPGARNDFREQLAGLGRVSGYAVWWTGGVIAPLLVAYGLWTRRLVLSAVGFFVLGLVYASAAFRSMLFIALLVVVLVVLVARTRRDFGVALASVTSLMIVACSVVAFVGWIIPISLLVRRLLVVPGQVMAYYYDAFASGPVYGLSHSILEGITVRPYAENPPTLIGQRYFHDANINANGNLWADGMANFGLAGIIAASLGLVLVLVLMDAAARGKPALLTIAVGGIAVWSLTNSGLLTTLLTHGMGVMMALFWLMPRAVQREPLNRPARIAHVTTVHPSDDPRIYLKECATLAEAGYEVILIGRGRAPAAANPGVRFVSVGEVRFRFARMVVMPFRVLAAARRVRAEVYHLHDPELLPVGVVLKLAGARVIYDAHEDLPRQIAYKPYLPGWSRRPVAAVAEVLEGLAVRCLDGVVAATPRIGARFAPERTTIVQNFPLTNEFGAEPPRPYHDRPPTLAYVGRLTEEVGAMVMADAARIVLWNRRDVRVVLAGPIEAGLAATLHARLAPATVEMPGRIGRAEVIDLLHDARVAMVLFQPVANYIEAYPTKLFEYMASEVPVVASDFPVWRTIVAEEDCGILVDPGDPEAVARAIEIILDDPERAAAMGRRGRAAVLARYR